ncbi:MAG: hypothetical protein GF364_03325, partial [Candidatus Lokiarchaeota archaeon]|nr:hypothetical protein [Candidatus Lokiarchaeota archaeon]
MLSNNDKRQIELRIDLAMIEEQKKLLKKKVKNVEKDAKSDEYIVDEKYAADVNSRLKAIKTVMDELNNRELKDLEELKSLGKFILDSLKEEIDIQQDLIKKAKRNFQLGRLTSQDYNQDYKVKKDGLRDLIRKYRGIQREIKEYQLT